MRRPRSGRTCSHGSASHRKTKSFSTVRSLRRRPNQNLTDASPTIGLTRLRSTRTPMALGYETIREIEREEIARSREIWASNENRRKEQDAKDKKRAFTDADRVSVEQRVPLPRFRAGDTIRVHAKVVEGDKER